MLVRCIKYQLEVDLPFIGPIINYEGPISGLTLDKIYFVDNHFVNPGTNLTMYQLENDFGSVNTYHANLFANLFEEISEERNKKIDDILC